MTGRIKLHSYTLSGKMMDNYLSQFRNKETKKLNSFTAVQFLDVWKHFDVDDNGYIEDSELDSFLLQFVTSVFPNSIGNEVVSQAAYEEMKREFLDAYDTNEDGRIEIGELSQILPSDEEFIALFQRNHSLNSSIEFMKVWKSFDTNCSGYIESDELSNFITYLLTNACDKSTDFKSRINLYTDVMLTLFDRNGDGKLQLSEMARLLPIKENFIATPIIRNTKNISYLELDRIFNAYDEDKSGQIEGFGLKALLVDILELYGEMYNNDTLERFENIILQEWDVNHDGKINKAELKMILTQQDKLGNVERKTHSRIILNTGMKDLLKEKNHN